MRNWCVLITLFLLGCNSPERIRIGDDSLACHEMLSKWGASNVQIAWGYAIDLNVTKEEAALNSIHLRKENDFNDNACFVWPELGKSTIVFFASKNGKLTEITRVDTSKSASGEWQRGFAEVTRNGRFVHAK